ncbi:4-hydroxy-tetrahydrodipicolinate reductase [Patiriisocius hiemis]|uniref:4-hydroxy-tetrahydrodipicolinate reductase n=1 Tax=Patiriisocius hiemis TaxID=3075604 RepID=A0ABU2Y8E4_9FLAO|nr:4-hydroxy-tetrahydrodipicolinate reductase [Constantimarinum sp. W242]MDT0554454.1 4-hydroxy-tetrahydrodipicolinate reductase [Constantimarinum sp. W242]
MKIALLGYGKMGKKIEELAKQAGHTIVYKKGSSLEEGSLNKADVAIEFSVPETAVANITRCFEEGIPVVSGTTGWLDHYKKINTICKNCNGSFIYASNFSVGVNLFFKLNEFAAKLLAPWDEYEVSMEEIHHIEKKDAPSGTAISLAEGIMEHSNKENWTLENPSEKEIEITAKRIKDVKGTHTIMYDSTIDCIRLTHEAHSRDGFAKGAILAASWLQDKKGIYTMQDVLGI